MLRLYSAATGHEQEQIGSETKLTQSVISRAERGARLADEHKKKLRWLKSTFAKPLTSSPE
jgi:inorganic triphosphatase YgiF